VGAILAVSTCDARRGKATVLMHDGRVRGGQQPSGEAGSTQPQAHLTVLGNRPSSLISVEDGVHGLHPPRPVPRDRPRCRRMLRRFIEAAEPGDLPVTAPRDVAVASCLQGALTALEAVAAAHQVGWERPAGQAVHQVQSCVSRTEPRRTDEFRSGGSSELT